MSKIAKVGAPVMIVTGNLDFIVPPDMGRDLFAAAHEPKRALFLPMTGHVIAPSAAAAEVSEFIARQGAGIASPAAR
jgi:fermentation-respiration switch protein FrsA (DUF1100 family)